VGRGELPSRRDGLGYLGCDGWHGCALQERVSVIEVSARRVERVVRSVRRSVPIFR
jgi:hypothetical protein